MTPSTLYYSPRLVFSGVLLAAYRLLLDRRVAYLRCRRFLLLLLPLACTIPLLRIPVWSAAPSAAVQTIAIEPMEAVARIDAPSPAATLARLLYAAITLAMLARIALQSLKIIRLSRRARSIEGTRIVSLPEHTAACSFFDTIFLPLGLAAEDRSAILAHEHSHIAHRHSFERIVLETFKALLWWNPFAWMAARHLVEIHEYEADSDVIGRGYDTPSYLRTIFSQLYGYCPEITNGVRNSLTKKRFAMMTHPTRSRYALLRTAALVPVTAMLVAVFGFTARAADTMPRIESATPDRQTEPAAPKTPPEQPLEITEVDEVATFQEGGIPTFRQWVMSRLRYPNEAVEAKIGGRVVVSFVIDTDGKLDDIEVLQSPHRSLSEEVIRILGTSPRWTPAKQNGKVVKIKLGMPVIFNISGHGETDTGSAPGGTPPRQS